MRKLIFIKILFLLSVFPALLFAQQKQEKITPVEFKTDPAKVPAIVKENFMKDFGRGNQPVAWATSKTKFEPYGWDQNINAGIEKNWLYICHAKTSNGDQLDAVFLPDGKLIRSREEVKNFDPPKVVLAAIEKSPYKDWKITKDAAIIRTYDENDKSNSHYDIVLQKGREKKHMYFDDKGNILENSKRF